MHYNSFTHSKPSVNRLNSPDEYLSALYQHPQGFARLYAQTYNGKGYSSIDFIWKGKWHSWSFEKQYTERGLARIACKLIDELTKD